MEYEQLKDYPKVKREWVCESPKGDLFRLVVKVDDVTFFEMFQDTKYDDMDCQHYDDPESLQIKRITKEEI